MTTSRSSRRRRTPSGRSHDLAAVKLKIIPARDATPITSLLAYARNKVGKTTLIGSASELGEVFLIDCEKGTSSIRKKYPTVSVYKLTSFEEIDEAYWFLSTQKHNYKFIAIDPITRLGQLCMAHHLQEKATQDLAADPYQPSQQDWGKTAELMRNVVMKFKTLCSERGWFFIVTAYERRRNIDDADEDAAYDFVIGPDAQPAVKGFLMGQMDIIGRLYVKHLEEDDDKVTLERRMLFGPHEIYEAGDRSDNLPRVMRRPTMKKILTAVKGDDSK